MEVRGCGSILLIGMPEKRAIRIRGAERVVVRDLKIDSAPLPFTQGEVTAVDPATGSIDVCIAPEFDLPSNYAEPPANPPLVIPILGRGQVEGGPVLEIRESGAVLLERVTIHAAPRFASIIRQNHGPVRFQHVDIRPPEGSSRIISSWRDAFHVKRMPSPSTRRRAPSSTASTAIPRRSHAPGGPYVMRAPAARSPPTSGTADACRMSTA